MNAKDYYKSIKAERNEWKDSMPAKCMHCGTARAFLGLEVHEIERRSHAKNRWGHTCNYLLLCEMCHVRVFSTKSHAWQLAVKLIRDPDHFDLAAWLRLKDPELNAPDRVTMRDIVRHLTIK